MTVYIKSAITYKRVVSVIVVIIKYRKAFTCYLNIKQAKFDKSANKSCIFLHI